MSFVKAEHVFLSYRDAEGTHPVLNDLSAEIKGPGLVSILGESGSGKSSLLFLFAGYLSPTKGRIRLSCPVERTGFLFQNLYLLDHLSAEDNVSLPLLLKGEKLNEARKKAKTALESCSVGELAKREISSLSSGQKARVALARSLVLSSPILLADEPTGSLDAGNAKSIMELFQKLGEDRLIVIVTHNEELAYQYSDQVYLLKNGKLVLDSKKERKKKKEPGFGSKNKGVSFFSSLYLALSFLKKRLFRVVLSLVFCSLCLSLFLTLCLVLQGGKEEIDLLSRDCFSYSVLDVSEKKEYPIQGKEMSLFKKVSLSERTEEMFLAKEKDLSFYPCLEALLPSSSEAEKNGKTLSEPIFFTPSFPSEGRLKEGRIPASFREIVISPSLCGEGVSLGSVLSIGFSSLMETSYNGKTVKDVFERKYEFTVVGIAKEKDILSRKAVYYDYPKMMEDVMSYPLKNLSERAGKKLTLKERFSPSFSDQDDPLTSFKTLVHTENAYGFYKSIENDSSYTAVSVPLALASSLEDMLSALSKAASLFLILSFFCSLLLLEVVLTSLYEEKKEEMALYLSYRIGKKDFFSLGDGTMWILFAGLTVLTLISLRFVLPLGNRVLVKNGLTPFLSFGKGKGIYALLVLLSFLSCYFTNRIPLKRFYSKDLIFCLKGE